MKITDDIKRFYAEFKTLLEESIKKEFDGKIPASFFSDDTTPPEEYSYYQKVLFSYYQLCRLIEREVQTTLEQKYRITPVNISIMNRIASLWKHWDIDYKNPSKIQNEFTSLFNNIDDITWVPKINDEQMKEFALNFLSILINFKNAIASNFKHTLIPETLVKTFLTGILQHINILKIRLKNYYHNQNNFKAMSELLDPNSTNSKIRDFMDFEKVSEWLQLSNLTEIEICISKVKEIKKQIEEINIPNLSTAESEKELLEKKADMTPSDQILIKIYSNIISALDSFSLLKMEKILILNDLLQRLEIKKQEISKTENRTANYDKTTGQKTTEFRSPGNCR